MMIAKDLCVSYGFRNGRKLSLSKSTYRYFHPLDCVIFNAYLLVLPAGEEKFWIKACDLNLTKEKKKLEALSSALDGHIFVYGEGGVPLYAHIDRGKIRYLRSWHPVLWFLRRLIMRPVEWYRWRKFWRR